MEMSNAFQKDTGISGVLIYSTKGEMTNQQAHSLGRVKLMKDKKSVSVSIKKDREGNRIIKGNDKNLIKILTKFVELNEGLLWEYWNSIYSEKNASRIRSQFKKVE